jgi:hypothetical protein
VCVQPCQITVTKTYNVTNLFEDIKALYKIAGALVRTRGYQRLRDWKYLVASGELSHMALPVCIDFGHVGCSSPAAMPALQSALYHADAPLGVSVPAAPDTALQTALPPSA